MIGEETTSGRPPALPVGPSGSLTALLPTRDRPTHCRRQLEFLRSTGFTHRIIVLDGSNPENSEAVCAGCVGLAEYRHFDAQFRMADKLAAAAADLDTPYCVVIPDDDLVLPDAIADAISHLNGHPDFAVAHGYFIDFRTHGNDIELQRIVGFTPSIVDGQPLRRHYNLFRRYQSFYWGVFRTAIFRTAVTMACAMDVVLFRELTVMSATILQGKVARLPLVYSLHGQEPSHAPIYNSHPLFFLLRDAREFFRNYSIFRDAVAAFIRRTAIEYPSVAPLEQLLDVNYATYLGREVDTGRINQTAELLLNYSVTAVKPEPVETTWRDILNGDVLHHSSSGNRRYIWRRPVMEAEPRDETAIALEDMARVERQLDRIISR
jgi:glycosyltransferase domain-containing protein